MRRIVVIQVTMDDVNRDQKIWIDGCCTADGKDVMVLDNLSGDVETDQVTMECFDAEEFNQAGRGGDCEAVASKVLSGDEWRELEGEGDVDAFMKSFRATGESAVLKRRLESDGAMSAGVSANTLDFFTHPSSSPEGYPMCARLILPGDGYGRWMAETQTWVMTLEPGSTPLVEFFDKRYMHTPFGQFTGGRYYLETVIDVIKERRGLCLDGGIPEWSVDADSMQLVGEFLAPAIAQLGRESINGENEIDSAQFQPCTERPQP